MDDVRSRIRSKRRTNCESLQRRECFGDIGVNYDINMVINGVCFMWTELFCTI